MRYGTTEIEAVNIVLTAKIYDSLFAWDSRVFDIRLIPDINRYFCN